ncbi:Late embryogenesis abundant protein [Heracleum sosnowskyi]|uniref:Late embryogenesis abundant protein n=1 Tax=Heracleum sosnowskyi TaxID=360622 RepID=A0AAD8I5I7_9APIA|nr:Late embryogenesis abundant protein [Heracleum sosnowskyi]
MAKSRKGLKICCGVTALIIIILIVVAIILFFTVFKPKQPDLTLRSVTLQNIKFFPLPFFLNVSLGITLTVDNPNYGSLKYKDSTTYVTYHGTDIAEAPIHNDTIPARGTHDISTNVVIEGGKMILNPSFPGDLAAGMFNFTASTTLHGKAIALKILKIKVKSINNCDISIVPLTGNVSAVCTSKLKF